MKIKHVDEIIIKMAPWERDAIAKEIKMIIDNHTSDQPYPLFLRDFAEELRDREQR